ncbi:hypothetical protein PQR34_48045 [Paraburkholderia sediminicola]|uniref:hypothetical protein n=1 Tax=Paraburkholderia sediminicola TaxID=458836 RepID=UPI0038BA7F93
MSPFYLIDIESLRNRARLQAHSHTRFDWKARLNPLRLLGRMTGGEPVSYFSKSAAALGGCIAVYSLLATSIKLLLG